MKGNKILNKIQLLLIYLLLNCFFVPNNQSARDICKEGSSQKTGKKEDLNFICSIAATNIRRAENSNDEQAKNNALLTCLIAIEDLRKCDRKANIKFSTTNERQ